MVDESFTHIRLKRGTAKMLREIGKKGETYDEIIRRLIDAVSKNP